MLYDARNKAAIESLHPIVQKKANALMADLEKAKIEILITEGFRSLEKQSQYYAIGRTTKLGSPKVTSAKAGYSFHNYGLAFDFVPVKPDKSIDYKDKTTYKKVADLAKQYGFVWGGDWKIKDLPHLEYTQGHDEEYFLHGGQLREEIEIQPMQILNEWQLKAQKNAVAKGWTNGERPLEILTRVELWETLRKFEEYLKTVY